MAKKLKKFLKKAGNAAAVAASLYGATKLGKKAKSKALAAQIEAENARAAAAAAKSSFFTKNDFFQK